MPWDLAPKCRDEVSEPTAKEEGQAPKLQIMITSIMVMAVYQIVTTPVQHPAIPMPNHNAAATPIVLVISGRRPNLAVTQILAKLENRPSTIPRMRKSTLLNELMPTIYMK
jgi:hypothetical protein